MKTDFPNSLLVSGEYSDSAFLGCNVVDEVPVRGRCYKTTSGTTITGCYAYNHTNSKCANCEQGYLTSSAGGCSPCPSNCLKCDSSTHCIRCKAGYVLKGTRTVHSCMILESTNFPNLDTALLFSPRYQSVYPATLDIVGSAVPMTLNGTLNYTYSTTIPVPVESTVLIHAKVVFTDSGNAANNIYSHHDVMVVWNKPDGTKEYLQTRSLPYDPTHTFPKGPLHLDVSLHRVLPQSMSITIQSLHAAEVSDFRYSVIQYGLADRQQFATSSNNSIICNRNMSLVVFYSECSKTSPHWTYYPLIISGYVQYITSLPTGVKFGSESKLGCALECDDGYFLTADRNCVGCSTPCNTCTGNPNNCTSCMVNSKKNLTLRVAPNFGSTCVQCGTKCLQCEEYTLACKTCEAGYEPSVFDSKQCDTVCPEETLHTSLASECVSNTTTNVTSSLSCPNPPLFEELGVALSYDAANKVLVFQFSKEVNTTQFLSNAKIIGNQDLFNIGTICEESYSTSISSSCKLKLTFFDKTEVRTRQIFADITGWFVNASCVRFENKMVQLSNSIYVYTDVAQTASLNDYSKYSSTAIKAILGVSFLTTANGFSSLLKLTQYIELYTYLNINMPDNLKAFLQYFSEDIFNLLFNPFDSLPVSTYRPPFGSSGLFLQISGQLTLVLLLIVIIKFILNYFTAYLKSPILKKLSFIMDFDWMMSFFDSILFELVIAVGVNFATKMQASEPWEVLNVIVSAVIAIIILAEIVLVGLYGYLAKKDKTGQERESGSVSERSSNSQQSPSIKSTIIQPHNANFKPTFLKAYFNKLAQVLARLKMPFITKPFKRSSPIATQYILIQQILTIVSVTILLAAMAWPLAQVLLISSIQLTATLLWLFVRPLKARHEALRESITSVLLSLVMFSSVVYTPDVQQGIPPKKLYEFWGNFHIVVISIVFFIGIVNSLFEIGKSMKETLATLRSKLGRSTMSALSPFERKVSGKGIMTPNNSSSRAITSPTKTEMNIVRPRQISEHRNLTMTNSNRNLANSPVENRPLLRIGTTISPALLSRQLGSSAMLPKGTSLQKISFDERPKIIRQMSQRLTGKHKKGEISKTVNL